MKKIAIFLALLLAMGATPVWAICGPVDQWIHDTAASENYPTKAGGMLIRGLHRIIESPIEIGFHAYDETAKDHDYGWGTIRGLGMGTVWMLDSVIRGAWDIVTFAFPDYYGEPGDHDLGDEIFGK